MSSGGKHASPEASVEEPRRRTLARALLVALPVLLPFETPLGSLGPLVLTTAELALYLVLAAWALDLVRHRRDAAGRFRDAIGLGAGDRLGRAVALWLAVVLVSAAAAPAHRAAALKFALRVLGGGLLFFAARDLVRSPADARRVTVAVVAGAALSAALAILESFAGELPAVQRFWELFRPSGFSVLGLRRAGGAFAYPTIGAMYWEAALPLALVVPLLFENARSWLLSLALTSLLVAAVVGSYTRTALVGAVLASGTMLFVGWRSGGRVRLAAGGALLATAIGIASAVFGGHRDSRLAERMRWWRDETWFAAHYALEEKAFSMAAGDMREVPVTVRNQGALTWPSAGIDAVFLSYHWETFDDGTPRLEFEGRRTPLPSDVPPGAEVRLLGVVQAPDKPGAYRLRWDLVRETVTWFSSRGSPTADQDVKVMAAVAGATPAGSAAPSLSVSLDDLLAPTGPSRFELWRAALRLARQHPLLGVGPDNFRRMYPDVLPAPGGRRFSDARLHANNLYLETLADLGLAGLVALALVLAALAGAVRARLRGGARLLTAAWGVAAGIFFLHGLLDYFLEFTPTYGLYWLSLAVAGGAWSAPRPSRAPPGSRSSAPSP